MKGRDNPNRTLSDFSCPFQSFPHIFLTVYLLKLKKGFQLYILLCLDTLFRQIYSTQLTRQI